MKYTKEDLKIDNSDLSMNSIYIYKGAGPYDSGWIGEAKGRHVGPDDNNERLGNARLFSKANRMYELLKEIESYSGQDFTEQISELIEKIEE